MGNVLVLDPSQLVSSTKLVRNLPQCLNKAKEKPLFIHRYGSIKAVILSIDEYRRLIGNENVQRTDR